MNLKQALAKVASEAPAKDSRCPCPPAHRPRVHHERVSVRWSPERWSPGTIRKEDELEVFPDGQARAGARRAGAWRRPPKGHRRTTHGAEPRRSHHRRSGARHDAGAARDFSAPPRAWMHDCLCFPPRSRSKIGSRVHFHAYTMEAIAEVRLYGAKQLKPGEEPFVQLRLAEPALLLPGDRFIVRQFSPVVTIGGGVVLDAMPLTRRQPGNGSQPLFLADADDGVRPNRSSCGTGRAARGSRLYLRDVPAEMNVNGRRSERAGDRSSWFHVGRCW